MSKPDTRKAPDHKALGKGLHALLPGRGGTAAAPAPQLAADFAEALAVAEDAGLIFAVEHNAPGHRLLVDPNDVEALLEAVPGLGGELGVLLDRHPGQPQVAGDRALAGARPQAIDQITQIMHV